MLFVNNVVSQKAKNKKPTKNNTKTTPIPKNVARQN